MNQNNPAVYAESMEGGRGHGGGLNGSNTDLEASGEGDGDPAVAAGARAHAKVNEREIEETAHAQSSLLPPYLRGPLDPARMQLNPPERQWAIDIKDAIRSLPDLDPISDFMCAHYALVYEGNVAKAIEHAYQFQAFRQEYDILDTFQHGRQVLSRFFKLVPGHVIHFFYCQTQDRYVVVSDLTKVHPKNFQSYQDRNCLYAAGYYFPHAVHLDLMSIRRGVIFTIECEGYIRKIPEMMDFRNFRILHEDVAAPYPWHFYELQYFNAGVFVNTLLSMVRRFLPEGIRSKMILGNKADVRLDTLCLVPEPAVAFERIEREVIEALRRRYEADKTFRLDI